MDFILNHLFVILLICIVLFVVLPLIMKLFKTAITLAIIVLLLGAAGVFGSGFLKNLQKPIAATQSFTAHTIEPVIKKDLTAAKFNYNPQTKRYEIQSALFKLDGVSDQNKATVEINKKNYTIDVSFIKSFIDKQIAKQDNQKT
ncbi:hypothetical protein [Heyndrickxia acidicola]|uniref:Uncharacterized protein n=1 Tax=Heyndrickxia acidicola TaxID=209389 RepID=A0ABU6MIR4_9BACI|nr:hypothetical protein [Heyndrickxia acidicola]MED1204567.1 hypothetical protein [Heyndrickxia acidicola]